jgi:hypothetical protein
MLVVFGSAVVSFAVAAFAVTMIVGAFRDHWPQIVDALRPDGVAQPTMARLAVRRAAVARPAWPAPVRLQPSRRAAA